MRRGLPLWLAWLITVVVTLVAVAVVVAAALIGVAHLIAEIPRYQAQLAARWQHATDALSSLGIHASGLTQGLGRSARSHRVSSRSPSPLLTPSNMRRPSAC